MPANIMLPTKAKITALVCSGRRRPKVRKEIPSALIAPKVIAFEEFPVHLPPRELGGDDDADEHADDAPEDGGDHEAADRLVVVGDGGGHGRIGLVESDGGRRVGDGRRFEIERQQRVALRTGAPGAADLHREAGDENPREAGGNQDGEGEDVHREVTRSEQQGRDAGV